jgi:hypothetical protein
MQNRNKLLTFTCSTERRSSTAAADCKDLQYAPFLQPPTT